MSAIRAAPDRWHSLASQVVAESVEPMESRVSADPSGADVFARIGAGDQTAVRECIDRFGRLVWSLARRGLKNAADVEDVVQDIFIDLWRSAGRFDASKASPQGFVAMIARRRIIDRQRSRGRRPEMQSLPETSEPSHDGHLEIERAVDADWAREALAVLKPDQRRFLVLALVEGHSHREIAELTNTPLGTVKSTIRRGLLAARATLRGAP